MSPALDPSHRLSIVSIDIRYLANLPCDSDTAPDEKEWYAAALGLTVDKTAQALAPTSQLTGQEHEIKLFREQLALRVNLTRLGLLRESMNVYHTWHKRVQETQDNGALNQLAAATSQLTRRKRKTPESTGTAPERPTKHSRHF